MKFAFACLTLIASSTTATARGRGRKSSKSKSSSTEETTEDSCTCTGTITTSLAQGPFANVQAVEAAAPPGCVWVAPDPMLIPLFFPTPPSTTAPIIVPAFKDPSLVLMHVGMSTTVNRQGWTYADGTAVPMTAWGASEPSNPAPGEPIAAIVTPDGLLADAPYSYLNLSTAVAFYECCGYTNTTCTGLVEATPAPTRAPTSKSTGMSRKSTGMSSMSRRLH